MAVAEECADGVEARVGQRLEERAVAACLGHPPSVLPAASVASWTAEPAPVTTSSTACAVLWTRSVAAFVSVGTVTLAWVVAPLPPAERLGTDTVTLGPLGDDGAEASGSLGALGPPSWRAMPPSPLSAGCCAAAGFLASVCFCGPGAAGGPKAGNFVGVPAALRGGADETTRGEAAAFMRRVLAAAGALAFAWLPSDTRDA